MMLKRRASLPGSSAFSFSFSWLFPKIVVTPVVRKAK